MGALSVILAYIHVIRPEDAVVRLLNPSFRKRFVDDIYTKGNENIDDIFFKNLNSFYPNISLTFEVNLILNTKAVLNRDGTITSFVYRKETKLPITWISKSPKRYKRNTVKGDLHRSKRISPDFDTEIGAVKNKYSNAGYPIRFIACTINNFNLPPEDDV